MKVPFDILVVPSRLGWVAETADRAKHMLHQGKLHIR